MKTLKYGFALVSCLLLAACDDTWEGQLSLQQPIALNNGSLVIPAGSHRAKIKATSRKAKLKIKINGKEQEASFNFPSKSKIKSFDDISMSPEQSGQPYAVKGSEDTVTDRTDTVRGIESCTWYTTETECGYETEPEVCHNQKNCGLTPSGEVCHDVPVCTGGGTVYKCHERSVSHPGDQEVEYYDTYTTTTRQLSLSDPRTMQIIGNFVNQASSSDRHYLYKSTCR